MKPTHPENRNLFPTGTSVSDPTSWINSLFHQMQDFVREWKNPSPRVEITSEPVDVQEIWSSRKNFVPGLLSLLVHVVLVTVAITYSLLSFIHPKSISLSSEPVTDFALTLPTASNQAGGGGGGMRAPTPASQGVLPTVAAFQLVPPTPINVNMNPELAAVPTIIDVVLPAVTNRPVLLQMGDPNGVSGPPSGGPGSDQGIGDGNDHGIGTGNGPHRPGPGSGPGGPGRPGQGTVAIGNGGATPPSCPIPSTEPEYTDDARKAHIQGTVVLDVVVNSDGSVTVNGIIQRLGYGLDDEASRFVAKNFKCKPGVYQGQPVATPIRINMNFHLY
ncbi:MAG TPA: energy transducer TonB [Terriglobia bacterium]|nr:energy transducer TonB [Terriglobia bacterium]